MIPPYAPLVFEVELVDIVAGKGATAPVEAHQQAPQQAPATAPQAK